MILELLATHVLKLDVGNEDRPTLELKAVRDAFTTQYTAVRVPRNGTLLARVQSSLEDVQAEIIQQYTVTVVKDDHVLLAAELVKLAIESDCTHCTLDNLVLGFLFSQCIEQVFAHKYFFNAKALAHTRGTRHDHCADIALLDRFGHVRKDLETSPSLLDQLFVCILCHRSVLYVNLFQATIAYRTLGNVAADQCITGSVFSADANATVWNAAVGRLCAASVDNKVATITAVLLHKTKAVTGQTSVLASNLVSACGDLNQCCHNVSLRCCLQ